MKHLTRVAAVAATTALATAGLVGTATTAEAKAAKLTTSYTCSTALMDFDLPVTMTTNLPAKAKAGKKVKASKVTIQVTVPADVVGAAKAFLGVTELGGGITGDLTAGKTKIALSGNMPAQDLTDVAGDLVLPGKGKTGAFKIAKKGNYVVKAPSVVKFSPINQDGEAFIGEVSCSLAKGAKSKLGTIKVTK